MSEENEQMFDEQVGNDMQRRDEEQHKKIEDFYPEDQTDIQGQILKHHSKAIYPWLVEDLSLANLKGLDKMFVTEALEIFKQLENVEKVNEGSFRDDLLHDAFARTVTSNSENMKKAQLFFTRNIKSSYEYAEREKKKKLFGLA